MMESGLARLGHWCARRARWVLATWVVLAIGLTGLAFTVGTPVSNDVQIPGSDSQRAHDLLRDGFGPGWELGGMVQLVLYTEEGTLMTQRRMRAIHRSMDRIRQVRHVREVETPYRYGGFASNLKIGIIIVRLQGQDTANIAAITRQISSAADPARRFGIEVVAADAGSPADKEVKTGTSEVIGLLIAMIVLMAAFGTAAAAGVPIITAILGLAAGLAAVGMLGHVMDVPKSAPIMASMVGLGVGIDYALFLLSRYRRFLDDGMPTRDAISRTLAASGGSVVFAGGTVVIALSALLLSGFPMLETLAWTTGIVVVLAVLAAITLVPAILSLLGRRINALRVPLLSRRAKRPEAPTRGWAAMGMWVADRPWRVLAGTVVLLGLLTAPALSIQFGQMDDGFGNQGTSARRAYELMSVGFGQGSNGPLLVVAELGSPVSDSPAGDPRLARLDAGLKKLKGVAHVLPPQVNTAGSVALVQVLPTTRPSDPATMDVVRRIRALDIGGGEIHVGGKVAGIADAGEIIGHRTPLVVGVVVGLSALLLLLAFRAPLVALKAALMNLVSLGAAFGVLSVVFSWGLGTSLIGMDPPPWTLDGMPFPGIFTAPIDLYVPLMLFAVLFGLSMDYEVFLLSAVRQAYLRTGDNRRSVAEGLGSTGRVITSAALIMVAVFTAFIAYPDPMVKVFGVGLAAAVAVDATIIRGLLVPATMVLLGRLNWWCPRWLDRILPPLSIADHGVDKPSQPPPGMLQGLAAAPPKPRELQASARSRN